MPRRFRAIETRDSIYGISLRQVFGWGLASARRSFFDGNGGHSRGATPDAGLLTFSPIGAMDVDGSGRWNWVVALRDGTILG